MSDGHSTGGQAGKSPPNTSAPSGPEGGLGRHAVRGTAFVFAGQVLVKLTALLSLWVLGYYLNEKQFGIWALALSTVALADCVRDMGAHKVLIQRGGEFDQLGSPVFKMGLAFNILAAGVLLGLAPLMARVYDDPVIGWLIVIAAVTIPLQSPVTVMRARLSIDLRFTTLVKLDIATQFVKNGSMILFALAGFGVYSFVLPMVLLVLFNIAAYRWCAGPMPPSRPLTGEHFRSIFAAVKWITISSFFGALISQGDRLVIGWFEDMTLVGVYFFGFQLILSTVVIFSSGMISVFMPTMSKLASDPERQGQAYVKMVRVSAVVFSVVCVMAVIGSGPAIHLLWRGRWDAAIPVAQLMSLSLCLYLIGPVAMSFIEASGRWRLRAAMLGLEMVGVMVAAVLGAGLGGLVVIAGSISAVKGVVSLVQCLIAGHLAGINAWSLIRVIMGPILLAGVCASGSYAGFDRLLAGYESWVVAVCVLPAFGVLYVAGMYLLMRPRFEEIQSVIKQLLPDRRPSSV